MVDRRMNKDIYNAQSVEDGQIVESVLLGDKDAFGFLINRYQKQIFNLMFRMCGNHEDAADLTQETFIKAYSKIDTFKSNKKFFPWLYAIGINHARDHLRKNKIYTVELNGELSDRQSIEEGRRSEKLDMAMDFNMLKGVVASLPLDYREAVMLRYYEDMSVSEIADALGTSVSGAKMRIHRALKKIRLLLKEKGNE